MSDKSKATADKLRELRKWLRLMKQGMKVKGGLITISAESFIDAFLSYTK